MIAVSFCLWFIVVYSVRVAVVGNPAFQHVVHADAMLVSRAEALAMGETDEIGDAEHSFLRRFFMLSVLELAMLVLELIVFGGLWWFSVLPYLAFALFAKDILGIAISLSATWVSMRKGFFETVLSVPRGLLVMERLSAGCSALGAGVLLLHVNGIKLIG